MTRDDSTVPSPADPNGPGRPEADHPVLDALEHASANAHRLAGALSRPAVSLVRVGRKRRRPRSAPIPA
ncbi:hypothetical protein MXD58_013360, partial [Frankia sp. AgKG'84/4]|nr:hypothetical protein [Frankia sp. AgKG'84/4]